MPADERSSTASALTTASTMPSFKPRVCVANFYHAYGPEIEHWIGAKGSDPTAESD